MRAGLDEATAAGPVWAFSCYDLETAAAVVDAASEASTAVSILVPRRALTGHLVRTLVAVAEAAPVPVCVQLDHVTELEAMRHALELGVNSVMADGSRLSRDENVELVGAAVALAEPYGASVEAELGVITGDDDVLAASGDGALTDPDDAAQFIAATGAACLAVSIGNVHGEYRAAPELDWPRLERLRAEVQVPLSLHGASGLSDDDVRQAVGLGIRKLNVNTELRAAYFDATASTVGDALPSLDLLALHAAQVGAVREVVAGKLRVIAEA